MTTTPPPKSPTECPPAPLWPAKFEHPREVRRSSRIAAGKQAAGGEPSTPTRDAHTTPPPTIKKDKKHARGAAHKDSTGHHPLQTPMKKKSGMPATPGSLHRSAKTASRISKFSLDQRGDTEITIFEDISARVPKSIGDDEDDIFKASSAKRRKTASSAASVEYTPPNTEGMVVVQRGRKIFKKFEEPSIFTGPMPRKNLFANYPKPVKAAPAAPEVADNGVLATDDEETEREESPEPPTRNVRFLEAEIQASETTTTTTTAVMNTPAKATRVQNKTPRRTPKTSVEIETSFLTPPATIQRDDTTSSFGSLGGSFERSSVKRKLSYSGPATPEATPAKKRSKIDGDAGIGTPRDDDVFGPSTRPRRGAGKSRS
ncbi:hypothetical protein ABW21_db0207411 [Orbilia brochopaga]|nr:hypothetical protein ABW21_db0207411 [Drechslerella brochopaga]